MNDALGSVQSVLVLGGGSDIALATAARSIREPVPHRRARGSRPRVVRPRRPRSSQALGATTVECVEFDALDARRPTTAFVADVFAAHRRHRPRARSRSACSATRTLAERDAPRPVRIVETNYTGAVSVLVPLAQAHAHARATARIVVLSSVAGERARKSNFVYGSSKAGLDAFCQGLGDSLAGHAACASLVVRPGFVHTKMTARPRRRRRSPPTPTSVAAAIVAGLGRGVRHDLGPGAAALRDVGAAPRAPRRVPPPALCDASRVARPRAGRRVRLRRHASPGATR